MRKMNTDYVYDDNMSAANIEEIFIIKSLVETFHTLIYINIDI